MRSLTVAIAAAMMGVSLLAQSSSNRGTEVTVRGEVVEIACATSKGPDGRGGAHAACALDCARRGDPLGILTTDAVYQLAGDFAANRNAKLLDFVAKQVTVTGTLSEQGGTTQLNVRTIRVN